MITIYAIMNIVFNLLSCLFYFKKDVLEDGIMADNLIPVDTSFVFQTYRAGQHMKPIARFITQRLNSLLHSPVSGDNTDSRLLIRTNELVSYEDLDKWLSPELTPLGFIVHPAQYFTQRNKAYHDEQKSRPNLEAEESCARVMLDQMFCQLQFAIYELKVNKDHAKENPGNKNICAWHRRQTESFVKYLMNCCDPPLTSQEKERYLTKLNGMESMWREYNRVLSQ